MSEVRRYTPGDAEHGDTPDDNGPWVRYADHARRVAGLKAQVAGLRNLLEAAEADAGRLRAEVKHHVEDLKRSADVLDEHQMMPRLAAELRLAAAELSAALAAGVGG